jgi:hypothetical protein
MDENFHFTVKISGEISDITMLIVCEYRIKYNRVPIIRHSVLSDVPCRSTPFGQESTHYVAQPTTIPHCAPPIFYLLSCDRYRVLVFWSWRDFSAVKGKAAQKHIYVTSPLKK